MVLAALTKMTATPPMGVSRYYQTAELLKDYIIRRKLPPNEKLPTVRQLVQTLGICEATINRALGLVEQQGFIERHPGKGIFVADRSGTGEIAVVVRGELLGAEASPFYSRTCSAIFDALHTLNPKWCVRLHVGKPVEDFERFFTTLDLLEHDIITRLRGVLTFHSLGDLTGPLAQQGIPVVQVGATASPPPRQVDGSTDSPGTPAVPVIYQVNLHRQSTIHLALSHLKERGCRTVGVLLRVIPVASQIHKKNIQTTRETVRQTARELGLAIPEPWLAVEEGPLDEPSGYEQFMGLWKNPTRPQGVLVLDDVLCRGVLRATLQLGVDLPGDLRLITASSKNFELPYHKPVSRVEIDHETLAREAVHVMETLIRGGTVTPATLWIEPRLASGETT